MIFDNQPPAFLRKRWAEIESNVRGGVRGFFTLQARKADNLQLVREARSQNTITDLGLNWLMSRDHMVASNTFVGIGTNAPSTTQQQMGNYLAQTTTASGSSNPSPTSPNYVSLASQTRRFAAGGATGNLTEVGVGWIPPGAGTEKDRHRIWSRALILDAFGDPVAFPVLADEILDVTYNIEYHPILTDATDTISISGVDYDTTTRVADVASINAVGQFFNSSQTLPGYYTVYTGSLGAITGSPGGTASSELFSAVSYSAYVEDSFEMVGSFTMTITRGNLAGGIKSLKMSASGASVRSNFQIEFSPNIPKDNTKTLMLQQSFKLTRL